MQERKGGSAAAEPHMVAVGSVATVSGFMSRGFTVACKVTHPDVSQTAKDAQNQSLVVPAAGLQGATLAGRATPPYSPARGRPSAGPRSASRLIAWHGEQQKRRAGAPCTGFCRRACVNLPVNDRRKEQEKVKDAESLW
jgi:hypothetical protein